MPRWKPHHARRLRRDAQQKPGHDPLPTEHTRRRRRGTGRNTGYVLVSDPLPTEWLLHAGSLLEGSMVYPV